MLAPKEDARGGQALKTLVGKALRAEVMERDGRWGSGFLQRRRVPSAIKPRTLGVFVSCQEPCGRPSDSLGMKAGILSFSLTRCSPGLAVPTAGADDVVCEVAGRRRAARRGHLADRRLPGRGDQVSQAKKSRVLKRVKVGAVGSAQRHSWVVSRSWLLGVKPQGVWEWRRGFQI